MLNLLIISSSPKAKFIQKVMQPQLKAKIDVVGDFDHGLKDVFEKRPAIVIIQDQIASITGESVARHIQLLLGSGAPTFIVMHEGNIKVKPIKGLFEYVVDLSQTQTDLIGKLVGALKSILGSGWDNVAIPLPASAGAPPLSNSLQEEKREEADQLVDDLLVDLGGSALTSSGKDVAEQAESGLIKESASSDELATMLLDAVQESKTRQANVDERSVETPRATIAPAPETVAAPEMFDFPVLAQPASTTIPVAPRMAPASPKLQPDADVPLKSPENPPVKPASPANFRISAPAATDKDPHAEDILAAFDENYRSRSRFWLILAVVAIGMVIAGWYLLNQGTALQSFFEKPKQPVVAGAPTTPQPVTVKKPEPPSAVRKPLSTNVSPAVPATLPSPSFVPKGGRDSSFAARKPGWERYVDLAHDVRIFRSGGRIKAIQIIAVKGQVIQDSFLKSVLKEVAGSSEYSPGSREKKRGYLVRRCRVGQKGDLLVYYDDPSEVIKAFVVSLD